MTFKYVFLDLSCLTIEPIFLSAKPNVDPTANPTIDISIKTIFEPTVKPTAEEWPTPTPTSILSLEENIKKQKGFFNIYLRI